MNARNKSLILVLALLGITFGVLCVRYSRGLAHDSFNQHLAELAGSDAVCCSAPNNSSDLDYAMHYAMTLAFKDGKPFWARDERHYRHLHSSAEWDVSEGFVFTSRGEMFQIDRYPPTFFRAARIIKYRVNVSKPDDSDRFLALSEKARVATYRLYP